MGSATWNYVPRDLRGIIKTTIQGLCDSDNKRTDSYEDANVLVSYTDNGTYYCVFRCVGTGRDFDHQAIWLYVPNDLEVDSHSLYDVIIQLKELVKGGYSGIVDDNINEIVSKIKTCDAPQLLMPANNDGWENAKYAFRKATIDNSLSDIIKKGYQKYYDGYKAILIFDKETTLTGSPNLVDLSDEDLQDYDIFTAKQLNLPDGVTPYLDNDVLFDKRVMTARGGAIRVTFKRDNYNPITNLIHIKDIPINLQWQFEVTKDMFDVRDFQTKESISTFTVKVDGNRQVPTVFYEFEENKEYKIEISLFGYETYSTKAKIKPGKNVGTFNIKKKPTKCFIKLKDDDNWEINLEQKDLKKIRIPECPILGYYAEKSPGKGDIWLNPDESLMKLANPSRYDKIMKYLLPIVILSVAILAGIFLGYKLNDWHNAEPEIVETTQASNDNQPTTQTKPQPQQTKNNDAKKIEEANNDSKKINSTPSEQVNESARKENKTEKKQNGNNNNGGRIE